MKLMSSNASAPKWTRVFSVLIAAWSLGLSASAAQADSPVKPITHESLWMMKRVGTPLVSPDGKWVVFSVLEPSYETGQGRQRPVVGAGRRLEAAAPHHQHQGGRE